MALSKRKKRKIRNALIISIATILIIFCLVVIVYVSKTAMDADSGQGIRFMVLDVPLIIAIVMIFFIAKDRLK